MDGRAPGRTAVAIAPDETGAEGRVRKIIASVSGVYEFPEPEAVLAFLGEHLEVLPLLLEGAEVIPRFVPPHGPITLVVSRDPEDGEDLGQLFAVVPTTLKPDDIPPRLAKLRAAWVIDAFRRSGGLFNVDVAFR